MCGSRAEDEHHQYCNSSHRFPLAIKGRAQIGVESEKPRNRKRDKRILSGRGGVLPNDLVGCDVRSVR